ncbi:polysaccharide deacetylase family protein [Longispora sp. NPDC051575]|uniref:polysaccharide deacetylase family protein n=1 Tax=Longispora sp. NPDC051575 TaxID=3154943 RepID=UPI0034487602
MRAPLTVVALLSCALLAGCGAAAAPAAEPSRVSATTPQASPSPTPSPSARPTPGAAPSGRPAPVVNFGRRTGNRVALTFDADLTADMRAKLRAGSVKSYANTRVLDVLEREKVPGTFFMSGMFVEEYPAFTRRLAANPTFELANHSYSHRGFTPRCYTLGQVPPPEMTADVARTFTALEAYGGRQTRFFRFPGLCHDPAALAAVGQLGVTVVDGDVVSGDPFATNPQAVSTAVLSTVRAGSIVIMHCTDVNAPVTDQALPAIIAGLRAKGLEPVVLSDLF